MRLVTGAQLVSTWFASLKILGNRLLPAIVSLRSENMVAKFGMVDERFDALPLLLVRVSDSVDLELYYLLGGERSFRHRFAEGV